MTVNDGNTKTIQAWSLRLQRDVNYKVQEGFRLNIEQIREFSRRRIFEN